MKELNKVSKLAHMEQVAHLKTKFEMGHGHANALVAVFRKKNFVKSFPHQTPVIMAYDTGNYSASLDLALDMADYKNFQKRKKDSAKNGKLRGIGFSAYIEACGIAPSAAVGSLGAGVGLWESAEIRVNPVGTVEVLTGSHSHGQGHETTFAQLVSDRLGISIDQVAIVHGDTDKVQFGMGTYGSRSGAVGMSAISKALDKVVAKAKKVAAYALEASEGDIEFKDGRFSVALRDVHAFDDRLDDREPQAAAMRCIRLTPRLRDARGVHFVETVEQMWQVAAADHEIDRYERTLVQKVADLLHVPRPAQIAARERALHAVRGSTD